MYVSENIESDLEHTLGYISGGVFCGLYFGFMFSLMFILAPIFNGLLGFLVRAMSVDYENDKFSISFLNVIFISLAAGLFLGTLIVCYGLDIYTRGYWLTNMVMFSPFVFIASYCFHDLIYFND